VIEGHSTKFSLNLSPTPISEDLTGADPELRRALVAMCNLCARGLEERIEKRILGIETGNWNQETASRRSEQQNPATKQQEDLKLTATDLSCLSAAHTSAPRRGRGRGRSHGSEVSRRGRKRSAGHAHALNHRRDTIASTSQVNS
jgi:hypothetical protein